MSRYLARQRGSLGVPSAWVVRVDPESPEFETPAAEERQDSVDASIDGHSVKTSWAILWVNLVVVLPLALTVSIVGWGAVWRTDGAALFICGATAAAFGENVIEQQKERFARVRCIGPHLRLWSKVAWSGAGSVPENVRDGVLDTLAGTFSYLLVAVVVVWNAFFVFRAHSSRGGVDPVEVVAVVAAIALLPAARWAFTERQRDVVDIDLGTRERRGFQPS
jgi:hypothetical protein